MRFADFVKTAVLLNAGSATVLAAITVISASDGLEPTVVYVSAIWWALASLIGLLLESRAKEAFARLMGTARAQTTLPELRPGLTLLNRLWLLLLVTVGAGVLGIFMPQVSSVAAGFALMVALAWRRQHLAVIALEERDAARFYVDRTSPLQPISLIRTPGFGGDFVLKGL